MRSHEVLRSRPQSRHSLHTGSDLSSGVQTSVLMHVSAFVPALVPRRRVNTWDRAASHFDQFPPCASSRRGTWCLAPHSERPIFALHFSRQASQAVLSASTIVPSQSVTLAVCERTACRSVPVKHMCVVLARSLHTHIHTPRTPQRRVMPARYSRHADKHCQTARAWRYSAVTWRHAGTCRYPYVSVRVGWWSVLFGTDAKNTLQSRIERFVECSKYVTNRGAFRTCSLSTIHLYIYIFSQIQIYIYTHLL